MIAFANALIAFSILAFVAFLIWNSTRSRLEHRRLQLDAQTRILEKIGPGQALTEFLTTAEGKRFFGELAAPTSSRSRDARTRILALTVLGLVALFAGLFFVMAFLIPAQLAGDPSSPAAARIVSLVPVFVLTGAAVGALVAAWIMHRLAKKWGMLDGGRDGDPAG